jgi:hypothetical protein
MTKKRRTASERAADRLTNEFTAAQILELAALQQLDADLAEAMAKLVKPAIAAATAPKPDIRLLRLLTRYASSAGRRLQAAHKSGGGPGLLDRP